MNTESLTVAFAITTLTSGFAEGLVLLRKVKEGWQERHGYRQKLARLEKLEDSLDCAKSSVQETYEAQYLRHGQRLEVGDDIARYILFALAERQKTLMGTLQSVNFDSPNIESNIKPLMTNINTTKTQATKCLMDLAARFYEGSPSAQILYPQIAALLSDFQGLCPSAARYRARLVHRSDVGNLPDNRRESKCHECGVTLVPTKLRIPNSDASSCILITLSGLFRAHCYGTGSGFTCIWQPRVPSCYGVFDSEKTMLKHMLAVHFQDNGTGSDARVDWPADDRRGDLEKSGFMVYLNGERMQNRNGSIIIPKPNRFSSLDVRNRGRTTFSAGDARASFNFTNQPQPMNHRLIKALEYLLLLLNFLLLILLLM
ncbi:MAG: hypothetical protein Q9227_006571 [Pyrenula ochraceoflavens]